MIHTIKYMKYEYQENMINNIQNWSGTMIDTMHNADWSVLWINISVFKVHLVNLNCST